MSNPAMSTHNNRGMAAAFWVVTGIFTLHMTFTAFAQLKVPAVAAAFAHLGYPAYFRVELAWAKLAGVAALLVPMVPARVKEWAYTGFAITLVSALFAHLSVGDGVEAWIWSVMSGCLWTASYFLFRRLRAGTATV